MLIKNNSLKKGDVVVLKVRNVEGEIIGRLEADYTANGKTISLTRALVGHTVQQGGGIGLAFLPFSLSARDDHVFEFATDDLVVSPFAAREEVKSSYVSQTTSLELPQSGLQL